MVPGRFRSPKSRRCSAGLLVVDDSFSMKPDSLEQAIRRDLAKDRIPFFVCATLGTTSWGAFDPAGAVGSICQEYGLWLHGRCGDVGNSGPLSRVSLGE